MKDHFLLGVGSVGLKWFVFDVKDEMIGSLYRFCL
jgi:hypothetical protein